MTNQEDIFSIKLFNILLYSISMKISKQATVTFCMVYLDFRLCKDSFYIEV